MTFVFKTSFLGPVRHPSGQEQLDFGVKRLRKYWLRFLAENYKSSFSHVRNAGNGQLL